MACCWPLGGQRSRRNERNGCMERMLEGVRVIEVAAWAFVPSAGAVLADWGADVIKVEPPTGDPMRGLISGGIGGRGGPSFPWEIWNRGKRSIALDLTHAEARDIVLKAAADADVFLTSYLPTTRHKLGLDIDQVRAVNPSDRLRMRDRAGPARRRGRQGWVRLHQLLGTRRSRLHYHSAGIGTAHRATGRCLRRFVERDGTGGRDCRGSSPAGAHGGGCDRRCRPARDGHVVAADVDRRGRGHDCPAGT